MAEEGEMTLERVSAIAVGDYPQLNAKVLAAHRRSSGYTVSIQYETGDQIKHEVDVLLDLTGVVIRRDEHPVRQAPTKKVEPKPIEVKPTPAQVDVKRTPVPVEVKPKPKSAAPIKRKTHR